jgi:hypothetical protein
LIVWLIRPRLLLVIRRTRLVRSILVRSVLVRPVLVRSVLVRSVLVRPILVRSVLVRIVRASLLPLVILATMIRLAHLRRILPVLLLLVVGRHGPSGRLRRLLTVLTLIRIHSRLIGIRRISLALFDSALISRHRPCGVSTRRSERGLVCLIRPVVRTLIAIPLSRRELIRPLRSTTIRSLMRRRRYNCPSR